MEEEESLVKDEPQRPWPEGDCLADYYIVAFGFMFFAAFGIVLIGTGLQSLWLVLVPPPPCLEPTTPRPTGEPQVPVLYAYPPRSGDACMVIVDWPQYWHRRGEACYTYWTWNVPTCSWHGHFHLAGRPGPKCPVPWMDVPLTLNMTRVLPLQGVM